MEVLWPKLLEAVGRVSPFTRSYLLEAFPASHVGNLLTIGFDPEFADHIELVNNTKNIELLQTKLKELGYPGQFVKFVKASAPQNWNKPVLTPSMPATPAAPKAAAPAPAPPGSTANGNGSRAAAPAAAEPAKPPAAPISLNPSDFKNDPLIQKALEIFRGRIVEVRS